MAGIKEYILNNTFDVAYSCNAQVNFLLVSSFRRISWRLHVFSTLQIPFLWATGEMEEKNGTYYKSNHECSATIEKPSMKQDYDYIKVR